MEEIERTIEEPEETPELKEDGQVVCPCGETMTFMQHWRWTYYCPNCMELWSNDLTHKIAHYIQMEMVGHEEEAEANSPAALYKVPPQVYDTIQRLLETSRLVEVLK